MPDLIVRQQRGLLWLLFHSPSNNMRTLSMLEQLAIALEHACKKEPKLVVLTGTGEGALCANYDVSTGDKQRVAQVTQAVTVAREEMRRRDIPLVGLIKGQACGVGCELALFCDTVLVCEDTQLLFPSHREDWLFPAILNDYLPGALKSDKKVMQFLSTEQKLSAREAWRLGIVHQVLAKRRFVQDAEELLLMLAYVR